MPRKKNPEPSPRHVFCWPKYTLSLVTFPSNPNQGQFATILSSDNLDRLKTLADNLAPHVPTTAHLVVYGDDHFTPEYRVDGQEEPTRKAIYLTGPPAVDGECRHLSALLEGEAFRCSACGEVLGPEYEVTYGR